MAMRDRLY